MAKVGDMIANQLEVLDDELHYVLNTTLTDIQLHVESHIDRIMYFAEKKRMLFQHCYRNKAEFQTRMLQAKLDGATVADPRMRNGLQVAVLNEYLVRLGQLERIHLPKVVREGDVFLSRQNLGGYTFLEYWKSHAKSAVDIYNTLVEIDRTTTQFGLMFPNSYIDEYRGVVQEHCSDWHLDDPPPFSHPFRNVPGFGDNENVDLPDCQKFPHFFWTNMFKGCDKIVRKASDATQSENGNDMAIWVKKQHPRKRNKWTGRYLMCQGGYLEYFDTDHNIRLLRKKPRGAIPLANVDMIARDHKTGGFKLVTKRRVFAFKAKDSATNEKVLYDIQCAQRWAIHHEDEVDHKGHAKTSVDAGKRYRGDGEHDGHAEDEEGGQLMDSMDRMLTSADSVSSDGALSWTSAEDSQDMGGEENPLASQPKLSKKAMKKEKAAAEKRVAQATSDFV
jgi:hypothetical protein